MLNLDRHEWKSDRNSPQQRDFPRKTWFGLTDYGTPDATLNQLLIAVLAVAIITLLR